MGSAVAYFVGRLIAAGVASAVIATTKRWWLVPLPFVVLFAIWGIGYMIYVT